MRGDYADYEHKKYNNKSDFQKCHDFGSDMMSYLYYGRDIGTCFDVSGWRTYSCTDINKTT